ncbi:hypothetical protein Goarm_005815, partial [Gossypium armourianum]|nr:hypothetical protein [Gossypium armourianum]
TGESPPKPWEQARGSSDSGTFKPPSIGSTNDVVEASGTARPGEIVSTTDRTTAMNRTVLGGYGGLYENSGMYSGGMYGGGLGGFGGPMGGYGMGGIGPYGEQDSNNPFGAPPSPLGFWISFLRMMQGVVNFFGRISILID